MEEEALVNGAGISDAVELKLVCFCRLCTDFDMLACVLLPAVWCKKSRLVVNQGTEVDR